jgi:hypothetical protein
VSLYLCQGCYDAICAIHGEQEVYTSSMTRFWACAFGNERARYHLPMGRERPFEPKSTAHLRWVKRRCEFLLSVEGGPALVTFANESVLQAFREVKAEDADILIAKEDGPSGTKGRWDDVAGTFFE